MYGVTGGIALGFLAIKDKGKDLKASSAICWITSFLGGLALDITIVGTAGTVATLAFLHIVPIPLWAGGVLVGFAGCYILTALTIPLALLACVVSGVTSKNCCQEKFKFKLTKNGKGGD